MKTNLKKNPKLFWDFVASKKYNKGLPDLMFLDDKSTYNSNEIANLFAKKLSSVYSKHVVVPPKFSNVRSIHLDAINIEEDEVLFKLSQLNGREGSGADCLLPLILKKCCLAISQPLTLLFNESLRSGIFPNKWRVAHTYFPNS